MADVLIASDSPSVVADVESAIGGRDTSIRVVGAGIDVLPAVLDRLPDLVVLDQQIGNMGAMACSLHLRLEESADRLEHIPILVLLDRRADVFLAKRSGADGWIMKPLDPIRMRKAAGVVLAGEEYHDDTGMPPVTVDPEPVSTAGPVG